MTNNLKVGELFSYKKASKNGEEVNLKITRVGAVSKTILSKKGLNVVIEAIASDDTNLILDVMNCLLKESTND